ncbi:fumarylacetoacetate hydrolase family protein [Ottowia sp. VDI28]|uniref:fumarylacetoacetate hydrolase family protein n=1 Tax=Ottowia sp. VDI28 TaxID=3133968 RepID=UPI003C2F5FD6
MKLARYQIPGSLTASLGIVSGLPGAESIVDVPRALAARGKGEAVASTMEALVGAGPQGMDAIRELQAWAGSRLEPGWQLRGDDVQWLTPLPPRSCFAAGRNFGRHRMESIQGNPQAGANFHIDFPTGFIKLGRALVPHKATVARPQDVLQFDYEVEIAVVVGEPLFNVSRTRAREAIFGYTVFNDLSAREWQLAEMRNQLVLIGKNFPGFGPVGPYILTADEVPDPTELVLWLEVNGERRQHSDCKDLIFGFDEMVAFWSHAGLEPGDLISTGTPDGVALHRKPDPTPFFLKPGDIVHAGVDQIGVLETRIV